MFDVVAAIDRNLGIGNKGTLPWPKIKGDMRFYRELTTAPYPSIVENRFGLSENSPVIECNGYQELSRFLEKSEKLPNVDISKPNAVIMGRKTWESLPPRFRPLKNRLNVVLSGAGSPTSQTDVKLYKSLGSALTELSPISLSNIYVIGGGRLFREAVSLKECRKIYLTIIDHVFDCDVFFPDLNGLGWQTIPGHRVIENGLCYRFNVLTRN